MSSTATLSVKLLHFENKNGLLPDGSCCDGYKAGTSICANCEYYFIFCFSDILSKQPCSIKRVWTEELASTNYYAFAPTFYTMPDYDEVNNPFVFPIAKWNVSTIVPLPTFSVY